MPGHLFGDERRWPGRWNAGLLALGFGLRGSFFCRRRLLCRCSLLRCGGRLLCRRLLRTAATFFAGASFRCCSCRLLRRRFLCRRLRFALYYTLCHDSVLLAHNRGVNHIICKRQEQFSRHPTTNAVFLRNFRWKVSKRLFFGHYECRFLRAGTSDSCGLIRNHATQEDQISIAPTMMPPIMAHAIGSQNTSRAIAMSAETRGRCGQSDRPHAMCRMHRSARDDRSDQ